MKKHFQSPKYFNLLQARTAYAQGENVTELLRSQKGSAGNESEIIEIAYDLQAGTYIEANRKNREFFLSYARELADIIDGYIAPGDVVLDVGTGELTTLSLLAAFLSVQSLSFFAFDISWSRIFKGLQFARENMGANFSRLVAFVGEISETPLLDKSIDITISSHALEPNGTRLPELLQELFRVTRRKLILFEPCYEMNSEAGRQRMDRLGYIKALDAVANSLGAKVLDIVPLKNVANPLNPTSCFIMEPPSSDRLSLGSNRHGRFSVPGTNEPLQKIDDFLYSESTGLCFPVLKSIPILKSRASILASALSNVLAASS